MFLEAIVRLGVFETLIRLGLETSRDHIFQAQSSEAQNLEVD